MGVPPFPDGGWPPADTEAAYDAIRRDEDRLRPGVDALCAALGLGGLPRTRFSAGSLPVYAVGTEVVLKLFPPVHAAEAERERRVLDVLAGRLPVPTPRVHAAGSFDGWAYVAMDHLAGEGLADVWPRLDDPEPVAAQVGELLAALHAVRDPALAGLGDGPSWSTFLAEQARTCVERQRARGLPEAWLAGIPAFLDAVLPTLAPPEPPCLLHTEVMREHLLVRVTPAGPVLSGLFDFEPAMLGHPEYEFASVGLFVSAGDPRALRALLLAYGLPEEALGSSAADRDRAHRVLAYALLHRYSNLAWYLRRVPPGLGPEAGIAALAAPWFGSAVPG